MQRDRRPGRRRAVTGVFALAGNVRCCVRIHKAENAVRLLARSLARSFASAAAAAADEIALIAPDHLHPPALALARLASSLASPSHLGLPPPPRFPFRILTLKIGPLGTGRAREEERESRTQHTRENRLTIVTVNQEEKARGGNAITCTSRGGKSRPFVGSV